MRPGWVTAILLLASALLLAGVPPLRDALYGHGEFLGVGVCRATGLPSERRLLDVVKANPHDAQLWLAFAEAGPVCETQPLEAQNEPPSQEQFRQAAESQSTRAGSRYRQATALAPDDFAVNFRYGLHLLSHAGTLYRTEAWGDEGHNEYERTAQETDNLRRAQAMFHKAARLDPENAAPDYMLAIAYLSQHEDASAFAALQSAIRKACWSLATRESGLALLRLFDGTGERPLLAGIEARGVRDVNHYGALQVLRPAMRTMLGLAETLRRSGKHEDAIVYYEAGVHLGRLMRTQSHSAIEGLVGLALSRLASEPFLAEHERQTAGGTDTSAEANERRWQVQRTAFCKHLRRHGRTDLAQLYEREAEEGQRWKDQVAARMRQEATRTAPLARGGGTLSSWACWAQAASLLVLLLIVFCVSCIGRLRIKDQLLLPYSYLEWLLALLLSLAAGQLAGVAIANRTASISDPVSHFTALMSDEQFAHDVTTTTLIGLGVWLLAALTITLGKRAEQRSSECGSARAYLATLRALLPPTFAACLLISVVMLAPAARFLEQYNAQLRGEIQYGEVEYWNLRDQAAADQAHISGEDAYW